MALEDTYPRLTPKIQAARKAGYSDEDIQGHLQQKMQTAFKAGYSQEEVNAYLGEIAKPSPMEVVTGTLNEVLRQATPDAKGAMDSIANFPEERQALAEKMTPVFGRAGEGVATVAQTARTAAALPMAIIPRGVNEAAGVVMDGVKHGSEYLLDKVLPKDISAAISEFIPDVAMILGGAKVHSMFKKNAGDPAAFIRDARESLTTAVEKKPEIQPEVTKALQQLEQYKAATDIEADAYWRDKAPKPAVAPTNEPLPPRQDNGLAIMRGEEPKPPPEPTAALVTRLQSERAPVSEPQPPAPFGIQPRGASAEPAPQTANLSTMSGAELNDSIRKANPEMVDAANTEYERLFGKRIDSGAALQPEAPRSQIAVPERFKPDDAAIQAKVDAMMTGKKKNMAQGTIGDATSKHIEQITNSEGTLEYKGKEYEAAVREGDKVRLKDHPDKVVSNPREIVKIEEKVPFDIPPEEPAPKAPADLRPAIKLQNDEMRVGEAGERHEPVFSRLSKAEQDAVKETGWVGPDGKFMSPDEAQIYKFRDASKLDLAKHGFGSETGAVGKLDEGMAQIERDAREARKELYRRLYNDAREAGISLKEAARQSNILQRDLARLEAEANEQKWQPSEAERRFTPLEKEMGKQSENPKIFEPIPDEFKGTRLDNKTTKAITEAAFEAYKASGKQIEKDIPISIQVARDIAEGNIPLEKLKTELEARGSNLKDLGDALLGTESNAGKQLQQMSALKQKLRTANIAIGDFKVEPPSGWEYSTDMFRRWINIWRGSLVTQLGTAVRNAQTQVARLGIDGIEKIVDGTLQQMFKLGDRPENALSDGFRRAMEDFVDLAKKGKRQQADEILSVFPKQGSRLFMQYASDVNALAKEPHPLPAGVKGKIAAPFEQITQAAEKGVEFANVVNRGQEFLIRRAAFRAKLAEVLEKKGQNIDSIDPRALNEADLASAVDHALEVTFATTPQKGPGKWLLDAYKVIPPLYFIAPFPKFMYNSWKTFFEYSPAGFLKLLSAKEREAIAAGNTKTLSRAIIGTGMLGAAYALRNSEYAGEKWYEINVGDKVLDTRPYNPFASYLFVADVVNRWHQGKLDQLTFKDLAQGLLSANFRAGTGLFMLDKVGDLVGGMVSNEGVPQQSANDLKRAVSETLAGFLTPFQTFRDVLSDERIMGLVGQEDFAKEEAAMRDVRDNPFLGPLKAKIPGLSQTLPKTQFALGNDAEREEPALKQTTGVLLRTKTGAQREADRLGFEQKDLYSYTGIPELDRETERLMRPVAERTLTSLMNSKPYQQASDLQKRIWFKKWIHDIGNDARRVALSQNRDLRIEYMIKKAGKDQGKLLRETFARRGLISAE